MRSKLLITLTLGLSLSACGILGNKEDVKRILEYKSAAGGCLNDFGPNMTKFVDGEISETDWAATWDCTIDSMDLFTQFVVGSGESGSYTQQDISNFVSKFLITDKSVSAELISASFALKASIIGGSVDRLTKAEVGKFMDLLRIGKNHSTRLIPFLKARLRDPSGKNLIALSNAIETFAHSVAGSINTNGNKSFTQAEIDSLINELSKLHGWKIDKDWIPTAFAAKVVLMDGTPDRIEGSAWPKVFRIAGSLGGPVLGIASAVKSKMPGPNEYGEVIFQMARGAKTVLYDAVDTYGGVIPFSKLEGLIDVLPKKWLDYKREPFKKTLKPFFIKVLGSNAVTGVDKNALNTLFDLAETWNRSQTHLETIYDRGGLSVNGVSLLAFKKAAGDYQKGLDSQGSEDVDRLMRLAENYKPLFLSDEDEITYSRNDKISVGNLSKFHWINLASKFLISRYGKVVDNGVRKADAQNVKELYDDFKDVAIEMKMFDPSIKDIPGKRLGEADMFMQESNGDGMIDEPELTYYVATLYSSAFLGTRLRKFMEDPAREYCRVRKPGSVIQYKMDVTGWYWMKADCWRKEFFLNYTIFFDHMPLFKNYYARLSENDRNQLNRTIEEAARRYGAGDKYYIGGVDTAGFVGVLHYIESMFLKYDGDVNQMLDLNEVLQAFPNFKNVLTRVKPSIDKNDTELLRAAFTFTVKYGHPPDDKNFKDLVTFLWWKSWPQYWKVDAYRKAVYEILPVVSKPDTPPIDPE